MEDYNLNRPHSALAINPPTSSPQQSHWESSPPEATNQPSDYLLSRSRKGAQVTRLPRHSSTLLNESALWNPDAIERQLAHILPELLFAYSPALANAGRVTLSSTMRHYCGLGQAIPSPPWPGAMQGRPGRG